MIQKIIALVLGLLTGGVTQQGTGATAAAGAGNSVLFYTGMIGFGTWLISPAGRNFEITLRGWEIWSVVLAAAIAGAIFLHIQPPKPPGQP